VDPRRRHTAPAARINNAVGGGGVEAQQPVAVDIPGTGTPEEDKSAADGHRHRHVAADDDGAADIDDCTRVTGTLVVGTLAAGFLGTYVWRVATSLTWIQALPLLLLPLVIMMLLVFFFMMSAVSAKDDDGAPRLALDDDDTPRALLDRKDDDQGS